MEFLKDLAGEDAREAAGLARKLPAILAYMAAHLRKMRKMAEMKNLVEMSLFFLSLFLVIHLSLFLAREDSSRIFVRFTKADCTLEERERKGERCRMRER